MKPELIPVYQAATRNKFRCFLEVFWHTVSNDPFKGGYLVDTICDHLQALAEGHIKRLYIACPIRHGKTIITQVLYPAWLWARDPSLRFVAGTHSEPKAEEIASDARKVITSELYQTLFPLSLSDDQNKKLSFNNEFGGKRKGCGIGTRIGGADADVVLVDDLIDYHKARFDAERKAAIEFYNEHLSKRLVMGTGKDRILAVGHRVHEQDLFSHLWETFGDDGSWTYLVLPEEARPAYTNSFPNGTGWKDTREEGELLAPERFDRTHIESEKKSLRHKYHCIYQQDTTPQKGERISAEWFRHYTQDETHYHCNGVKLPKDQAWRLQTCDTAISTTTDADYTVVQTWDIIGDYCVLVAQLRKKLDGTKIIPAIEAFYRLYRPQFLVVEEEFIGKFVIDQLREKGVTVRRFNSKGHGDKKTRAIAIEIRLEAKKVWFPADAEWTGTLEAELLQFPNGGHDDQVDACSQMAITADRYRGKVEEELTPEQLAEKAKKQEQERFNRILNSGTPF